MAGNEVSRPIHVLFNGDNFSQWSQAISSYLKGRKLWRYVSGVRTIPIKEEKESDAAYDLRLEEWESSNHQIITWFRNTSIPSIIDEFSNLDLAKKSGIYSRLGMLDPVVLAPSNSHASFIRFARNPLSGLLYTTAD